MDSAVQEGQLLRQVQLSADIYEGTDSLSPPLHPLPKNLAAAKDLGVFYPILRCYAHRLADPTCKINRHYHEALKGWASAANAIPLTVGEYYNVSKFEDLPLLFSRTLPHDFRSYHEAGCTAVTFMHLPMCNWGVRALTYTLYAKMAWNTQADAGHIAAIYFQKRYASQADRMQRAYALLESAWRYSANLRSWSPKSILSQLLVWDGRKPDKPLIAFEQHEDVDAMLQTLQGCVRQHRQAVSLMRKSAIAFDLELKPQAAAAAHSVNPAVLNSSRFGTRPAEALRVDEDLRGALYGLDVLQLTALVVAYHEALRTDDHAQVEALWPRIQRLARHMRGYYAMVSPDYQRPVYTSKDALTRSQLSSVVYRIQALRNAKA